MDTDRPKKPGGRVISRSVMAINMKKAFKIIAVLIFCFTLPGCKKVQPNLSSLATQVKSITVYDLEGLAGPKYSEQDLKDAFKASLDPILFQELATHAKFKDAWVLWKGSSLAVIEMKNGVKKQLALSYYGSFFKILGEEGFFYFEGEARQKWNEAYSKKIIQDDFIPKRIERNRQVEERKP